MMSTLRCVAGRSCGRMNGVYFTSFVCTSVKYFFASVTSSGLRMMSSSVSAITLAPAVEPLCAIGVAIAIASTQLCPGVPGMFAG